MSVRYRRLEDSSKGLALLGQMVLLRQGNGNSLLRSLRLLKKSVEYQFLDYYFARVPKWRLLLRGMRPDRVLPDFATVGPIKAGTSDLTSHLLLHPNVVPPLCKEIHSPRVQDWRVYYPTRKYMEQRRRDDGTVRTGYFTPQMHWSRIIDGYHHLMPTAKVILMLRDPVDRAYSHWKWDVLLGGGWARELSYYRDFDEYVRLAIDRFPATPMDTICGRPFLETGIYFKSVELWLERFGPDNVLIVNSNDYFRNRGETLDSIFQFLDLPPMPRQETDVVVNRNPKRFPAPSEQAVSALVDFYDPFNRKLYGLLGRDLGWKAPRTGGGVSGSSELRSEP